MSLRSRPGSETPPPTAQVARAGNPHGTTAVWIRDRLVALWNDEDSSGGVSSNSAVSATATSLRRPRGLSPVLLARGPSAVPRLPPPVAVVVQALPFAYDKKA